MLLRNKAQALAEYAFILATVLGALMAMQVYLKRGFQGKIKTFVDSTAKASATMINKSSPKVISQYEPYYLTSKMIIKQLGKKKTTHLAGGGVKREYFSPVQDNNGNYIEGNVIQRQGTINIGGTKDDDLANDDEWEK
jgi:uncharacterized protein (UPF0333 family)